MKKTAGRMFSVILTVCVIAVILCSCGAKQQTSAAPSHALELEDLGKTMLSAYLSEDMDTLGKYITDTYVYEIVPYGDAGEVTDVELEGLPESECKIGETVSYCVYFVDSNIADLRQCMDIDAVLTENGWRVEYFGVRVNEG